MRKYKKIDKQVFPYYGGKFAIVKKLLKLVPKHNTYVEVFGGAGSLLFQKNPSKLEVYNDIWGDLVNFMRVLQDEKLCLKLFCILMFSFNSREMWIQNKKSLKVEKDSVKRAAAFYDVALRSFSGDFGSGWAYMTKSGKLRQKYFNSIFALPIFHLRLEDVVIENRGFEKIIDLYDHDNVFFYFDPPYLGGAAQSYIKTFKESEHIRLLEKMIDMKGMILLSGYESELYSSYLKKWKRVSFLKASSANYDVSRIVTKQPIKKEVIWMNDQCVKNKRIGRIFK